VARIRTIKPEFWTDEKMSLLDVTTRLVFLGLISLADDAGRLVDNVKLLDGQLFPNTDDSCRDALDTLARMSRITRYRTSSGQPLLQITKWESHQKVDKPSKYVLPGPSEVGSQVVESKTLNKAEEPSRESRDESPEESRESRAPTLDLVPTTPDLRSGSEPDAAPLDWKRLGFTPGMLALLAMFYEPAFTERQRERYRDVASQLRDTMPGSHPGPKIRGGTRVKARSLEHLDETCQRVMADPPMNRDMAIVFVLNKLLDPPKGPTASEQHKASEDARTADEEAYQRDMRTSAVRWARENPDEYSRIVAEIAAQFDGVYESAFTKMARDAALSQRCSERAGFPDYQTWHVARRGAA
jgi:hypothetical protein